MTVATTVANQTSKLCNAARAASSKASNQMARRSFVQSAKDIAAHTAALVKAIKFLDNEYNDPNREACRDAARLLSGALEELSTLASAPEFLPVPARIAVRAKPLQEPMARAGQNVVSSAIQLLRFGKALVTGNKAIDNLNLDSLYLPKNFTAYCNHWHDFSETLNRLISVVKDACPGQRECDQTLSNLQSLLEEFHELQISGLDSRRGKESTERPAVATLYQQLQTSITKLDELCDTVKTDVIPDPERIGRLASTFNGYAETLVCSMYSVYIRIHSSIMIELMPSLYCICNVLKAQSALTLYVQQLEAGTPSKLLLEQSRMVLDASIQLMGVVRDCCLTLQTGTGSGMGPNSMICYSSECCFSVILYYMY